MAHLHRIDVARRSLQEDAGRTGGRFTELPHRADVIRWDLSHPAARAHRMAGEVHQRRARRDAFAVEAHDAQLAVTRARRVLAENDLSVRPPLAPVHADGTRTRSETDPHRLERR